MTRHPIRTLILPLSAALLVAPLLSAGSASAAAVPTKKRTTPVATTCAVNAVTPGSYKRARYIWKRVRSAGYSPAAAAGVLGNLDHVSALSPTAMSLDKTRFGIAQWPAKDGRAMSSESTRRAEPLAPGVADDYLLREMAGGFSKYNDASYRTRIVPVNAASAFATTFMPPSVKSLAARTTKARLWLPRWRPPAEPANDIGT